MTKEEIQDEIEKLNLESEDLISHKDDVLSSMQMRIIDLGDVFLRTAYGEDLRPEFIIDVDYFMKQYISQIDIRLSKISSRKSDLFAKLNLK